MNKWALRLKLFEHLTWTYKLYQNPFFLTHCPVRINYNSVNELQPNLILYESILLIKLVLICYFHEIFCYTFRYKKLKGGIVMKIEFHEIFRLCPLQTI